MTRGPGGKPSRLFVPVEVASFLRAPYGWTIRMRREEGALLGEQPRVTMGFWTSLAAALAAYGPVTVGALLGWRGWGGWPGAGLGALLGLTAQLIVFLAAVPIVQLVRSRRSR